MKILLPKELHLTKRSFMRSLKTSCLLVPLSLFLISCTSQNEKLVRSQAEAKLKASNQSLEVQTVDVAKKLELDENQRLGYALLGLSKVEVYPVKVTFKATADCMASAEALKNDVLFGEKAIGCKAGPKDRKYVKQYKFQGFRQVAVYEPSRALKVGDTIEASGELIKAENAKKEVVQQSYFKSIQ
jgi:hypothetical protein